MFKAYHVIAPHFANDFLSIVAARLVHVHGQFDRLFPPAQILRTLFQMRQPKADEVVQGECFIRVKSIERHQPFIPEKLAIIILGCQLRFPPSVALPHVVKHIWSFYGIYH
jgi:hypothetical protein